MLRPSATHKQLHPLLPKAQNRDPAVTPPSPSCSVAMGSSRARYIAECNAVYQTRATMEVTGVLKAEEFWLAQIMMVDDV